MLTCNPTKYWLSVASFFFLFNFPPSFYLKSHDRTRIRDFLCQCGVTRAGQYRGHLSFRLFLYAMSLNYLRSITIWKFVSLRFGMFFYCIVAFLVGKVGGIIRCFTLFSMLSWFSWMSGFLSCWNAVKNLLCFNIIRLSTTQESRTFF